MDTGLVKKRGQYIQGPEILCFVVSLYQTIKGNNQE